jgi:hypothetical protein
MLNQLSESTSISEKSSRSLREALCRSADPKLFDTTNWLDAPALNICRACAVKELCVKTVNPVKTFFDGVAGGFLWMNGRALVQEYLRLPSGSRPYANYRGIVNYLEKIGVADKQLEAQDHKINRCGRCGEWCYDRPICPTCEKGNGDK